MIEYIDGDVLVVGTDVIAHQTNCIGKFGAGVALQIRKKFPHVYDEYMNFCNDHTPKEILGECLLVNIGDNKYVANLFGELTCYPKNVRHTDYDALENALKFLKYWMTSKGLKTLAIPDHMSCGLAGGDWKGVVLPMLINLFEKNEKITLKIVKFNKI